MDWKRGELCGVGVSQLPACSAWQGPVHILFCFTSYRFRKAFRLSNNSRVMLQITAQNYLRHVLLLPRGQFILKTQPSPSPLCTPEQITGLSSCLVYAVHVKEFLRFFSWQHLENNVWNQKQILLFLCCNKCIFQVS